MWRQVPKYDDEVTRVAEPILVAQSISKQFPGVRALEGVDIDLMPGEVHALVVKMAPVKVP